MEGQTSTQTPPAADGASNTNKSTLGVGEVLTAAWNTFKEQAGLFIGLTLIPVALFLVIGLVVGFGTILSTNGGELSDSSAAGIGIGGVILMIIAVLVSLVVQAGIIKASLVAVRGGKLSFQEALQAGWKRYFGFLGLIIVIGLLVGIGFIALIIPGIIALFLLMFAPYAYMDKDDATIGSALKVSRETIKGKVGLVLALVVIYFVVALITNFIPLVNLVAGLILGPISTLSLAHIYTKSN